VTCQVASTKLTQISHRVNCLLSYFFQPPQNALPFFLLSGTEKLLVAIRLDLLNKFDTIDYQPKVYGQLLNP